MTKNAETLSTPTYEQGVKDGKELMQRQETLQRTQQEVRAQARKYSSTGRIDDMPYGTTRRAEDSLNELNGTIKKTIELERQGRNPTFNGDGDGI